MKDVFLKKQKFKVLVIRVIIKNLLYLTLSQAIETVTGPKSTCPYSAFFFRSIMISQLLSAWVKSKSYLLPVSELKKFHALVLNFGG